MAPFQRKTTNEREPYQKVKHYVCVCARSKMEDKWIDKIVRWIILKYLKHVNI